MKDTPRILVFVKDLNFMMRIENSAQRVGFEAMFIESADELEGSVRDRQGRNDDDRDERLNGILLDRITSLLPALIIFDLGNKQVPWEQWISLISVDPATRRFPVICFGSHVDVDGFQAARKAGAGVVVARSKFFNSIPELIEKNARYKTREDLEVMCAGKLSKLAVQGLEEFNRREYFEAHESLELAWLEDETPGRDVYRAALQVAVAYYQVRRGNFRGAKKMFLRLRQWIDPLPDNCRGINIQKIRDEAREVYQQVLALGPGKLDQFDQDLLRPIEYQA